MICEENRERRAKARLSDFMEQIAVSCLLALKSGAFRRLSNLKFKGWQRLVPEAAVGNMLAFPAPSLLTLTKNHLDHFAKINRSRP